MGNQNFTFREYREIFKFQKLFILKRICLAESRGEGLVGGQESGPGGRKCGCGVFVLGLWLPRWQSLLLEMEQVSYLGYLCWDPNREEVGLGGNRGRANREEKILDPRREKVYIFEEHKES